MESAHRLCLEVLGAGADDEVGPACLWWASSDAIRERAPKRVVAPETLDFKTLMPVPGGLFDYKVFGPGTVIDAPAIADDEPVGAPRKTQFARITLGAPILHPLACAKAPAALVALAGLSGRVEDCSHLLEDAALYSDLVSGLELAGHGALALRELPILPPDLRPLRRLDDDRWAVSPLNDLYRRVIGKNARLAHVVETNAPDVIIASERRALHESILQLFDGDGALRSLCGGNGSFLTALRALAALPHGAELTGALYRAASVLFGLAFTLEAVA